MFQPVQFGTIPAPDDAYRYAQDEVIKHPGGFDMQLDRPLGFYAVTDHGFYLGVVRAGADTSTEIFTDPAMKSIHNPNAPANLTLESMRRNVVFRGTKNMPAIAVQSAHVT